MSTTPFAKLPPPPYYAVIFSAQRTPGDPPPDPTSTMVPAPASRGIAVSASPTWRSQASAGSLMAVADNGAPNSSER